jgi:hypothetical protein
MKIEKAAGGVRTSEIGTLFDLERTTMEDLSVLVTQATGAKMLCA